MNQPQGLDNINDKMVSTRFLPCIYPLLLQEGYQSLCYTFHLPCGSELRDATLALADWPIVSRRLAEVPVLSLRTDDAVLMLHTDLAPVLARRVVPRCRGSTGGGVPSIIYGACFITASRPDIKHESVSLCTRSNQIEN